MTESEEEILGKTDEVSKKIFSLLMETFPEFDYDSTRAVMVTLVAVLSRVIGLRFKVPSEEIIDVFYAEEKFGLRLIVQAIEEFEEKLNDNN